MKPYFLWDYNLSEKQVKKILTGQNQTEKHWLMGRILTHAHFRDIWKYLKIRDIKTEFTKLKLRPDVKRTWENALKVWGYNA